MAKKPLKIDPTRTTMLRKRFVRDMDKRFRQLAKDVREFLVKDDALGLMPKKRVPGISQGIVRNVAYQQYAFDSDPNKVTAFRRWLHRQVNDDILSVDANTHQPWTNKYIDSAYRQGVTRAFIDTNKEVMADHQISYHGSREEFLRSAFNRPERVSKIEMLYTRTYNNLEDVTSSMSSQMSRILADGIANGRGAPEIARELSNNISKMDRTRARVIARTEVIHAHAEGQLDSFQDLGIKELGVMVEWSTAGDGLVCEVCGTFNGRTYTVEEARGLIPKHPNCRCAWIPSMKKRKEPTKKKQITRSRATRKARTVQKKTVSHAPETQPLIPAAKKATRKTAKKTEAITYPGRTRPERKLNRSLSRIAEDSFKKAFGGDIQTTTAITKKVVKKTTKKTARKTVKKAAKKKTAGWRKFEWAEDRNTQSIGSDKLWEKDFNEWKKALEQHVKKEFDELKRLEKIANDSDEFFDAYEVAQSRFVQKVQSFRNPHLKNSELLGSDHFTNSFFPNDMFGKLDVIDKEELEKLGGRLYSTKKQFHQARRTMEGDFEEFIEFLNNNTTSSIRRIFNDADLRIEMQNTAGRAYIQWETNTGWARIQLYGRSGSKTIAHELGHMLEMNPNIRDKTEAWLKRRARMNNTPRRKAYSRINPDTLDDNMAYENRFFNDYVGVLTERQIGTGRNATMQYKSSEAISMGLQEIADPYDTQSFCDFALADFDHFTFLWGILQGAI